MVSANRYGLVSSRATWGGELMSIALALLWHLTSKTTPHMFLETLGRTW